MKILAAVLLGTVLCASAIACDKVDAAKVQFALSDMGTEWSEQDDHVTLHWGREWDGAAPAQRLDLLRAFAQGDHCLAGRLREIRFFRKGKLVGSASPAAGVQLAGDAAVAQVLPGPRAPAGCAH